VSSTTQAHERVRAYLRELDAALRGAPSDKARELKEQIAAHLDEAIAPDAEAEHITEVLDRLGSPAELAADVGQAEPWLRRRLAQVSPRGWIHLALTLVLAGITAFYVLTYVTPDSLQLGGDAGWWYPQDNNHAHDSEADGATQSTVPVRPGQRQGILIAIYNPADVTQTVLGPPAFGSNAFWDSLGLQPGQVRVSVPNSNVDAGGMTRNIRFVIPGAIPPHQYRELRVTWISNACIEPTGGEAFDSLALRVRIGWITTTEVVPLDRAFGIHGPSHLNCH
jgi:hypothetical protein